MITITKKKHKLVVPYNLVSTMRAGVLTMGPLLSRYPKKKIEVFRWRLCFRRPRYKLASFRFKSLGANK